MNKKPSLLDPERGAELRDKAIDRLENANLDFVDHVEQLVFAMDHGTFFTTDDLWCLIEPGVVNEPRAMGAAMKRVRKLGLAAPISEWRLSKRAACHRRPLRVWTRTWGVNDHEA